MQAEEGVMRESGDGAGGRTVVVASNNKKKLGELREILARLAPTATLRSAADVSLGEPEESGTTFLANALIKAEAAYRLTGEVSLADDSGLEVDALGGEPGVHSARFAGPDAKDADNNAKLLSLLESVSDDKRTGRYRCVIVVILPSGVQAEVAGLGGMTLEDGAQVVWADGAVEGQVLRERRGEGGFGYDPWMLHPPTGMTFAELPSEVKNTISHRGQALAKLEGLLRSLG